MARRARCHHRRLLIGLHDRTEAVRQPWFTPCTQLQPIGTRVFVFDGRHHDTPALSFSGLRDPARSHHRYGLGHNRFKLNRAIHSSVRSLLRGKRSYAVAVA